MEELRAALITDGTSDAVLIPVVGWLLREYLPTVNIDLRWINAKGGSLAERIEDAFKIFPCQVLFVHRDAEKQPPDDRYKEIETALSHCTFIGLPPVVCVVPVRMTEAWLLFDETAIRQAAGNPNGKVALDLPPKKRWEEIADPKKDYLYPVLKKASELHGRRLKDFREAEKAKQVAGCIVSFEPLRGVPAFDRLEKDVKETIEENGWDG